MQHCARCKTILTDDAAKRLGIGGECRVQVLKIIEIESLMDIQPEAFKITPDLFSVEKDIKELKELYESEPDSFHSKAIPYVKKFTSLISFDAIDETLKNVLINFINKIGFTPYVNYLKRIASDTPASVTTYQDKLVFSSVANAAGSSAFNKLRKENPKLLYGGKHPNNPKKGFVWMFSKNLQMECAQIIREYWPLTDISLLLNKDLQLEADKQLFLVKRPFGYLIKAPRSKAFNADMKALNEDYRFWSKWHNCWGVKYFIDQKTLQDILNRNFPDRKIQIV